MKLNKFCLQFSLAILLSQTLQLNAFDNKIKEGLNLKNIHEVTLHNQKVEVGHFKSSNSLGPVLNGDEDLGTMGYGFDIGESMLFQKYDNQFSNPTTSVRMIPVEFMDVKDYMPTKTQSDLNLTSSAEAAAKSLGVSKTAKAEAQFGAYGASVELAMSYAQQAQKNSQDIVVYITKNQSTIKELKSISPTYQPSATKTVFLKDVILGQAATSVDFWNQFNGAVSSLTWLQKSLIGYLIIHFESASDKSTFQQKLEATAKAGGASVSVSQAYKEAQSSMTSSAEISMHYTILSGGDKSGYSSYGSVGDDDENTDFYAETQPAPLNGTDITDLMNILNDIDLKDYEEEDYWTSAPTMHIEDGTAEGIEVPNFKFISTTDTVKYADLPIKNVEAFNFSFLNPGGDERGYVQNIMKYQQAYLTYLSEGVSGSMPSKIFDVYTSAESNIVKFFNELNLYAEKTRTELQTDQLTQIQKEILQYKRDTGNLFKTDCSATAVIVPDAEDNSKFSTDVEDCIVAANTTVASGNKLISDINSKVDNFNSNLVVMVPHNSSSTSYEQDKFLWSENQDYNYAPSFVCDITKPDDNCTLTDITDQGQVEVLETASLHDGKFIINAAGSNDINIKSEQGTQKTKANFFYISHMTQDPEQADSHYPEEVRVKNYIQYLPTVLLSYSTYLKEHDKSLYKPSSRNTIVFDQTGDKYFIDREYNYQLLMRNNQFSPIKEPGKDPVYAPTQTLTFDEGFWSGSYWRYSLLSTYNNHVAYLGLFNFNTNDCNPKASDNTKCVGSTQNIYTGSGLEGMYYTMYKPNFTHINPIKGTNIVSMG